MRLPLAISALLAATTRRLSPSGRRAVSSGGSGGSSTIKQLLDLGYEIKSSLPNGSKFIVFMQKDKAAYACEFVTVARSRCESLN